MNFTKAKLAALLAEFVGTGLLTFVILSVSNSSVGLPYFTAIAAGLLFGMATLVLGPVSGAHINPAVTLGQWTVRKIDTLQAILYMAFQVFGAVAALKLFEYFLGKSLPSIAAKNFEWRTLISEGLGAMILTLGVTAVVYRKYDRLTSAALVGTSLMLGIVVAAVASNGLVNPAVALGANSFSKAYWVGPALGALIGTNVYAYVFADIDNTSAAAAVATPSRTVASESVKTTVKASSAKTTRAKSTRSTAAKKRGRKPAARRSR